MKSLKLLAVSALASATVAHTAPPPLSPLRAQDQRLLRIADPILADNARLCDRTMPDLGVALQSTDQYPTDRQPAFDAPVAFAAVLPGSAAAEAGIEADDGLLSVDGAPVEKWSELASAPLRDSAFAAIAAHDPAQPLELGIAHDGSRREVAVPVKRECRALVEILDANGSAARSDDHVIQIDYGLATRATDDQLAVMFAHELAHLILHHSERLAAADVHSGLLGELGRNRRLNLEAEEQADRLSVYLLANAGIDPEAAPDFWRSKLGRHLSGGIFHDLAHPPAKERAKLMDAEIAAHIHPGQLNFPPALLATRTEPLK